MQMNYARKYLQKKRKKEVKFFELTDYRNMLRNERKTELGMKERQRKRGY